MKRNKTNMREVRSRPRGKYAIKRRENQQMYSYPGFSCCANDPHAAAQAIAKGKR